MLEKIKSLGLTWKFGVIVFTSLTLVVIILLSILSGSLNSRLDVLYGSPKTTGIFVAELLADELAPVVKKDINSLEVQQELNESVGSYYKAVYGIYSVRYILVQDSESKIFADTFNDKTPAFLISKNTIDGKTHCEPWKSPDEFVYFDCAVPLKMGDAGTGAVRVGILQQDTGEEFAQKIKREHASKVFSPVMTAAILFIIFLTAALTAAFWFFVIRRIQFLTEFTEKMSFGELEIEVPVKSDDEIGHLEETLERMRINLREAIERLKDRLKRR